MDSWLYLYFFPHLFLLTMTMNSTDLGQVRVLDAQQDERIRLECSVTSKFDAEEVDVESYFFRLNAFTSTGGESTFETFTHID